VRLIPAEHTRDEGRRQLAGWVAEHLKRSNYEIDKEGKALRQRPSSKPHG
jgi:hypothetical protein